MEIRFSLHELESVATKVIEQAKNKTLLFYGEMGAGKTTLVKEIVRQLGSKDQVSSPSFSLVNEYKTPKGSIYHFDFYRIETLEEAYDIGFEEYLDSPHWKLIEWPEKIKKLLPGNVTKLHMEVIAKNERKIQIG